jgi:hypothetical protein
MQRIAHVQLIMKILYCMPYNYMFIIWLQVTLTFIYIGVTNVKKKQSQWKVRCTVLHRVYFFAFRDRAVVTALIHNVTPIQTEVTSSCQELLITVWNHSISNACFLIKDHQSHGHLPGLSKNTELTLQINMKWSYCLHLNLPSINWSYGNLDYNINMCSLSCLQNPSIGPYLTVINPVHTLTSYLRAIKLLLPHIHLLSASLSFYGF